MTAETLSALVIGLAGRFNLSMEDAPPILALVKDLLFASKISATARAAGVAVRILRDPQQLATQGGAKLLVDLDQPAALDAAIAWQATTGGVVIGFAPHVDTEIIQKSRAAGLTQVMTRGQFDRTLPEIIIRKW